MKSKIVIFLAGSLFVLSGCQSLETTGNNHASQNISSANIADWKKYSDEIYGFTFSYPPHLTVVTSNSPGSIANIYPESLTECIKISPDGSQCQDEFKSPLFGLWDDSYMENNASNEVIQSLYSGYNKLSVTNLDVFEYDNGVPPIKTFHINTPDKSSGIEFVIVAQGEEELQLAKSILQTFSFR